MSSIPSPLAAAARRPADNNEDMVRAALVAARAVVFVVVGILTFTAPWPGAADGSAEVAGYALTGVLLSLWGVAGWVPVLRDRSASLLPWALGLIAVACGAAALLPGAPDLIALSVIAVIVVGSSRGPVAAWAVTGAAIAAVELAWLAAGAGDSMAVGFPAALLLGLLFGLSRRAHRVEAQQAAELAARSAQLREQLARAATLDERTRIAREIHDVLAHALGALGVHIQLAQAVLTDQHDEERAVVLLEQAREMAADGLAETRRAVHALRGQTPELTETLAVLGADHQRRHGAQVTVQVTGEPRQLPPEAALALTRVAQEALVNSAKHAPHQPVRVQLDYAESVTSLVVANRLGTGESGAGRPALATANSGYGLTGMRERLLLLDGSLTAAPSGAEWLVRATVPA